MNNDTPQKIIKKNRISLVLIAAFLALPYLVVFIYQMYPELSVKTGMSNKGELFSPVHNIDGVAGDEFDELKGKWTLLYVSGSSCDQSCLNQHYTMRQVRLASGKRRFKIERLNLIAGESIDADYLDSLQEFTEEKQIYLNMDETVLKAMDELPLAEKMGRIYLMDPYLNIVLRYSTETDPKDLLHDINKLIME